MSLFGPVTNVERLGWQRHNTTALAELLAAAQKADLPAIAWQFGLTSGLVGRCLAHEPAECRAQFEAWATFLGEVERWPERSRGGHTHLHATRKAYGPRPGVDVVIVADLYDEGDEVPGA